MADVVVDGMTQVWFVTTIAVQAAPTAAEITAGTVLGERLRADGLEGWDPTSEAVDTTSLTSTFNTSVNGRTGFDSPSLTLKKQNGTDDVFTALKVFGTNGYVVMRLGVTAGTAATAAQKVEVYPVQLGQFAWVGLGEPNSVWRYRVPCRVSGPPSYQVAVA